MTTHFGRKIYRAYTVELSDYAFRIPQLRRRHLEELLDQNPWAGKTVIINGPAGSGKTTLALQWALQGGRRIQYISAHGIPSNMLLQATPPWQGGEILAEFINQILHPDDDSAHDPLSLLYTLTELTITSETLVVLDDLHLLNFRWTSEQLESASEVLSRLNHATIIAVTRSMSNEVLQFFQQRGPVRIIGPNQLHFTPPEVTALATLSPHGSTMLETAQRYGGWATGVSWVLNSDQLGKAPLDDYVLNEILYTQQPDLQGIMLALVDFPMITAPLVLDLFEHAEIRNGRTSHIFSSLPLVELPDGAPDDPAYLIADGVREVFGRLSTLVGDLALIRTLHQYGITWYINHQDFEAARTLAQSSGLEQMYLQGIMPYCAKLADNEKWEEIRSLVVGMPEGQVAQLPQLAFWSMIADSHAGRWIDLFLMSALILETWPDSNDPYKTAKVYQIQAWGSWQVSDLDATLSRARLCFDTLPEFARLDKMMASITAENAARTLGDTREIEYWTAQTGRYHTMRSDGDEWWHVNAGFHRLDHMATCGDLSGAYKIAGRWLADIPETYPRSRFRYALLQFYIALEWGDDDQARRHLEESRSLASVHSSEKELEMAMATWFTHMGQYDDARAALNLDFSTIRLRLSNNYHRIHLLAAIEEASDNIELANDILIQWFGDEERWPRYFGEPHHGLIRARILARQGDLTEAIDRAQRVTRQAERRGHLSIAIEGLAIEAAAYHILGNSHERDQCIMRALKHVGNDDFLRAFSPLGVDVRTLMGERANTSENAPMVRLAPPSLTEREQEILQLVARGYSNTEISQELFISLSTVKNHLASIYRKLGVRNRRDAIQTALHIGGMQEANGRS
ncbi:MAG: LuxR C-terminal-related transcriptional regulator [Thermomicrobiales bacterium]|nr:LuxR C-terminal-related transcriptional regulator [Thermomicrobiales bacterium]